MNALSIFLTILVVGVNVANIYGEIVPFLVPTGPEPNPNPNPSNPGTSNTEPPAPSTPSTTASKCHKCLRNNNGMCARYEAPCDFKESLNMNGIDWTVANDMDCDHRGVEEVKVCSLDCQNKYRIGRCPSTLNPVCGYSIKTRTCRKFANPCLLKQDACRYLTIMDWRVTELHRCQNLRIGGPAGTCI